MAKTILRQVSCNHCAYGRPRGVDYSQAYCEKTKRIGSSSRARTCEKFESRLKTSSDYVSEKGFKYRSKQVDDYRTRRQWEEAGYIVKDGERGHEMHSTMMTDKTFIYYLPDEVEPVSAKKPVEECCASCFATSKETKESKKEKIKVSEEERALRKELGLPVTKSLVYFKRNNGGWKQYPVESWEIVEKYSEWCTLKIHVEELGDINIHSAFFSEMQKPSFERDMEKADSEE